jgi:hypothetical protein
LIRRCQKPSKSKKSIKSKRDENWKSRCNDLRPKRCESIFRGIHSQIYEREGEKLKQAESHDARIHDLLG